MTEPISDKNATLIIDLFKGLDFSPILNYISSNKTYTYNPNNVGFSNLKRKTKNKNQFIQPK